MNLYHAIFCCNRDSHYLASHVANVDALLRPTHRCVYYGIPLDGKEPCCDIPYHVVDALDIYENLPVKTWCLLKHALQRKDWDVLLKTDANTLIADIDLELVSAHSIVGYVAKATSVRLYHTHIVHQRALSNPYDGPLPTGLWVGGPAYTISRQLAEMVVAKGVWYARGHAYEDQMVSLVAEENGFVAQQGIHYKEVT